MAVPFLHNIDLNQNELLNAKIHTDSSAPSNPGTGSVWFDTNTNLLKIYRGGSWDNLFVKTEAIVDGGTNLATADQIHSFVTGLITQEDLDFSGDSGTGSVDLNSQTFAITGDTGITTTASGQGLSIDLDDTASDMTATNSGVYGSATAIPVITVDRQGRLTAATTAAISTTLTVDGDSGAEDLALATDDLQILGTTGEIDVAVTKVSTDVKATIGLADTITGNRTFSNNVTIGGNLTINGTTTDVDTQNLVVEDPLIKLAKNNNSSDSLDIGFYGLYDTSGSQDLFAGLFRDAGDDKFKLFKGLQAEPNTTVNTSGTGYSVATLVANIEGNLTGTIQTASQTNITGVGTITTGEWQATDIAIAHGGTGASTAAAAFTNLKQAATTTATGVVELATATEAKDGSGSGKVVDASQIGARSVVATIDVSDSTFTSNRYAEITHNLGTTDTIVQLYDTTTEETVYADVARTDKSDSTSANKVKITFGGAGSTLPTNDIRVVIASNKGASAGTVAYS